MKLKFLIPLVLNGLSILFLPYHVMGKSMFESRLVWRFVLAEGEGIQGISYGVLAAELSFIWLLFFCLIQKSDKTSNS